MPENAQTPTSRVHALLGSYSLRIDSGGRLSKKSFILYIYSVHGTVIEIVSNCSNDSQQGQTKIAEKEKNETQPHHNLIEEISKNPSTN